MGGTDLMDKLVSLAKRRGYVFQSSEIYGGTGSVWDYGSLGAELKRNVKERWWRTMVHRREDIEGIDASIIMHPKVWEASGHVDGFTDPLVECGNCHRRFRDDLPEVERGRCPTCGSRDAFGEPRMFNLMFRTFMGPVEDAAHALYLRPETAQGIYTNFLNIQTTTRQRVPFGIAQIGKAFRNEITPGNFIFRTREFEQAEMQFFVKPGSDEEWFERWREERMEWHRSLGIREERLRFHEHGPDELAHYAKRAVDVEYEFPFGWKEFEGIHNRTDFDLGRHEAYSGKRLAYIDPAAGERFIPYVVETSLGVDRLLLVLLAGCADGAQARPVLGAAQGRRLSAREEGRAAGGGPAHLRRPAGGGDPLLLRPGRIDRPPVPPPGRGRNALVRDGGRADGGGWNRDHPGPRHAGTAPRLGRPRRRVGERPDRRLSGA